MKAKWVYKGNQGKANKESIKKIGDPYKTLLVHMSTPLKNLDSLSELLIGRRLPLLQMQQKRQFNIHCGHFHLVTTNNGEFRPTIGHTLFHFHINQKTSNWPTGALRTLQTAETLTAEICHVHTRRGLCVTLK